MNNRLLPLIVTVLLAATSLTAQVCGTYEGSFEEQVQKHPDFYKGLEELDIELESEYRSALNKMKHLKVIEGKKIIPVVVHVIHDFGAENITDAEIHAAIDALNKNINGQSDKFLAVQQGYKLTPDIFAARRGVADIEFRLAKLTPVDHNCDTCTARSTTGILRVQSELTDKPENNNAIKALSYWNSYQYLNIWTVKAFNTQDDGGTLLGFAQFPWTGRMSTDGVALLASEMDDVTSTTLTHEVGHWLGLRHIWGDALCGDDGVLDTPPQHSSNGFTADPDADPTTPNPSRFPWHVGEPSGVSYGCVADSLNPAGEMFMNYMDYTDDRYCTMFSAGQVEVINETLQGEYDAENDTTNIGYREYMWSAVNIAATGVADGYVTPACKQKADFKSTKGYSVCLGENIVFNSNKNQFGVASINSITYDFGDGNTDQSEASSVSHTFDEVGNYSVSLTIEYDETVEARAYDLSDLVGYDSYEEKIVTLNVQGTEAELIAMNATNITLHLDLDSLSVHSKWKYNAPEDSVVGAHSSFPLGLDTFQLVFSADKGDSLELDDYARLALCFATWEKDSTDWEGTVKTFYYGSYESEAFNAYFMDTLFYRGQLNDTTYVAYYNNSCTSITVKENLIVVNPISSSNTLGSYTYSFEDASELSADWNVTKDAQIGEWGFNNISNSSWEWADGVAVSGSAGLMINGDNILSGTIDELVSMPYNLSALTNPAISFSWSGAAVNMFPENELRLSYSINCGEDWSLLGTINALTEIKGVLENGDIVDINDPDVKDTTILHGLANAGLYTTSFKPQDSEWNDTIMTNPVLSNNNIMFKFEYDAKGVANNFYLDNIRIGEASDLLFPSEGVASRLSIYPNPTFGKDLVVKLEQLADKDVEVKLVNILGSEVMSLFEGKIVSDFYSTNPINLSHLEDGIYFVNVIAEGNIIKAEKLIHHK